MVVHRSLDSNVNMFERGFAICPSRFLLLTYSAPPATSSSRLRVDLMTKPAFANLRFGDWSRILAGQINRGHYALVVDKTNNVHGFAGWA